MAGERPPGMSESEWRYHEGRALVDHGAEIGGKESVLEGLEITRGALIAAAREGLRKIFSEIFPDEAPPEDIKELKRRVDKEVLSPEDYQQLYEEDEY